MTGEIPEEFGGLTNLEELDLSGNQFTGEIPEELVNLRSLYFLRLSGNELTRCIPGKLREVADSDLGDLGLPFCDVLLSGLTINPGSAYPAVRALSNRVHRGGWSVADHIGARQ